MTPSQVLDDALTASDAWAKGQTWQGVAPGDSVWLDCTDLFYSAVPLYESGAT